jgi:3-hydroxyacyl-CoA dehydrogenase/enoyl-CoA hydratase/3-hydroxybutyryl-CoA epimerase
MTDLPKLIQFRLEPAASGVVHLVFDCPGRTMNVFSEAAIVELGAVAEWLAAVEVRGLVIRSGKGNAFCAGADLTELGLAYDMIVAAPERRRFDLAFDHFFRLSRALRALETAGKPVAAAIGGLALGGGCELALAAHHRVLADDPRAALGLPESLVGLLPGAGGTQRLPRLLGIERALPILLDGARLAGSAALEAGLVHALADPGDEVRAAEAWVLSADGAAQPWDRDDWVPTPAADAAAAIAPVRDRVLRDTQGHYPAALAILDCVEHGLPQLFDGAMRSEMAIFAHLIQREEPRNMIATLFLAKTDYERLRRKDALPTFVTAIVRATRAAAGREDAATLAAAGFSGGNGSVARPASHKGYWIESGKGRAAGEALARIGRALAPLGEELSDDERRLADYAVVAEAGYPAYLGGPYTYARRSTAGA